MNNQSIQIQKIVFDYFRDVEDETILDITNSFTFTQPATNPKVSELVTKFLQDQKLEKVYVNYLSDLRGDSKFSRVSSHSDCALIEDIKTALLVLSFNRAFNSKNKKVTAESETKKNLKFLKSKCLEILRCLNDNENYIYGKEEDEALVEKIEKIK